MSKLSRLAQEAQSYGWELLARHRATVLTYVLKDEHGEMDFNTLDEVEQQMRKMQQARSARGA